MAHDPLTSPAAGLAGDRAMLRLAFLAKAGEALASSLDYERTLNELARLAVPELGDLCMVDVCEDGRLRRVAMAHVSPARAELMQRLAARFPDGPPASTPAGRVMASGRTELLEDVDPRVIAEHTVDAEHARLIEGIGIRSHLAVPMRAHGRLVGVLCLGISESDRRYGREDRVVAEELARRAALAVENARLYREAQREIEQRRRTEAALRLSESRMRGVMEQSLLSTQRLAPDGTTLAVNRAWEALWGLRLEDIAGYSVLADPQLEASGTAPLLRQAFAGTPSALPVIAYDPRATRPDLEWSDDPVRYVRAFAYPVRDDDGRVCEVVLVHEDVTEEHRARARLQESEARLQRALDAGHMVVWDWNLATGTVTCSPNAEVLWGRHIGHANDFQSLIHAEDLPRVHAATQAALAGAPYAVEYRLRDTAGQWRWMHSRGDVECDATGNPVRLLGATVETTARRSAEDAAHMLADAGALLGASLDYATTLKDLATVVVPRIADWYAMDLVEDGVLQRVSVFHPDPSRVELAWDVFRRYPPQPGRSGALRVLETGNPECVERIDEAILQAVAVDAEHLEILRGLRLGSYICAPLVSRGQTIGVITLVHAESGRRYGAADVELAMDIARRAATAVDNARLFRQLQEEHRHKDEFLATLAHELRNPLAPIRTGLALLERSQDPAVLRDARQVMARQLGHMVRLIDDLLDLSRVTRGAIELQRRTVDLAGVVSTALEASRPMLDNAGLHLAVTLPGSPVLLDADDTRLSQVLTNLLNNAAKFTPRGGHVELRAVVEPQALRIEVRDDGIGIDPARLEQVFEMFARTEDSRMQGGLGIGLTLSRRLIELHGGTLVAESAGPGSGSRFVIRLPVEPGIADTTTPPAPPTAVIPESARVLVVDDNADAAQTLATLLEMHGHDVRSAADGPAALALLWDFVPDLAFLDIGLPGMSGHELAVALRSDPRLARTRLVAVTGWGREEDRVRSREAGFDAHLTKPVEPGAVLALMQRAV